MIPTPIVAGNWKMHYTPQEGYRFVEEVLKLLLNTKKVNIIFCPPFTTLFHIHALLQDTPYALGAQNIHWESQGAFTGEVSPLMVKSCGAEYVIIGHSERRHVFHEPDDWINRKVKAALAHACIPILCIGETLKERNNGFTPGVLENQLQKGLAGIEERNLSGLVVAYEPVWAIGTGVNASVEQVEDAHHMVREVLTRMYTPSQVAKVPVLYGGSVTPDNAGGLITTRGVNGFLIGGASLKADAFASIITIVEKNYQEE